MTDCGSKPTKQFVLAISWREQAIFKKAWLSSNTACVTNIARTANRSGIPGITLGLL